jgi:hypothetical protein
MTNKISIQFNEIEGEHLDVIKKLVEKPYEQLSQEDLMEIRTLIDSHRDLSYQDEQQQQLINKLLNIQLDSRLYRPIDQRSFIEYVTDIMYNWVCENLEFEKPTFITIDVFDVYFADGTMTYNTQQTLNYIQAFWDEFHKYDLEYIQAKSIFARPEAFFVRQSCNMAEKILKAIFGFQETYNKQDFLDYVDNEFDAVKLTELIY